MHCRCQKAKNKTVWKIDIRRDSIDRSIKFYRCDCTIILFFLHLCVMYDSFYLLPCKLYK